MGFHDGQKKEITPECMIGYPGKSQIYSHKFSTFNTKPNKLVELISINCDPCVAVLVTLGYWIGDTWLLDW